MSKERKLMKNMIIYFIGSIASKIINFLLLPFYTGYLTTEEYGKYDMQITIVTLLAPIISLALADSIYRYLLDENESDEEIISTGIITLLISIIILTIIFILLNLCIDITVGNLILLYLNIVTFTVLSVYQQVTRGLKKNLEYSVTGVIITAILVCSNIITISVFKMKVNGLLLSNVIAYGCGVIYIEFKMKLYKNIRFKYMNLTLLKKMLIYSIPLIPNLISWWVVNLSDRFLIVKYLGSASNGIYAISNKFSSILVLFNTIFNLAWQESAIEEYTKIDKDVYYTKMFNSYMVIQLTAILLLIPITSLILPYIVNSSYLEARTYIPWLYLASAYNSFALFYGTGYQSAKETRGAFTSSLISAIINIVLNILFIKYFGLGAAVISTLVSYVVMWGIRIMHTKKYFNININIKHLVLLHIYILITIYIYVYMMKYITILLVINIGIFTFFNRKILVDLFKYKLRRK